MNIITPGAFPWQGRRFQCQRCEAVVELEPSDAQDPAFYIRRRSKAEGKREWVLRTRCGFCGNPLADFTDMGVGEFPVPAGVRTLPEDLSSLLTTPTPEARHVSQ